MTDHQLLELTLPLWFIASQVAKDKTTAILVSLLVVMIALDIVWFSLPH